MFKARCPQGFGKLPLRVCLHLHLRSLALREVPRGQEQCAGCRFPAFQAAALCDAALGEGGVRLEGMTLPCISIRQWSPSRFHKCVSWGQSVVFKVTQLGNNKAENWTPCPVACATKPACCRKSSSLKKQTNPCKWEGSGKKGRLPTADKVDYCSKSGLYYFEIYWYF